LAKLVPYRYANPATIVAERTLSYLVIQARNYLESHSDVSDEDLIAQCQSWLDRGADVGAIKLHVDSAFRGILASHVEGVESVAIPLAHRLIVAAGHGRRNRHLLASIG
jgi:hypothetical protein